MFGVGGAGGNIVNNMIVGGLQGVEYIAANTDKQVLDVNSAQTKLQIGKQFTGGKGAGGNPEVGKKSTEESIEDIKEAIKYSDMLFITAGMGGGTGTGGAPIVAKNWTGSWSFSRCFCYHALYQRGQIQTMNC